MEKNLKENKDAKKEAPKDEKAAKDKEEKKEGDDNEDKVAKDKNVLIMPKGDYTVHVRNNFIKKYS
jgi:hypothetical protein